MLCKHYPRGLAATAASAAALAASRATAKSIPASLPLPAVVLPRERCLPDLPLPLCEGEQGLSWRHSRRRSLRAKTVLPHGVAEAADPAMSHGAQFTTTPEQGKGCGSRVVSRWRSEGRCGMKCMSKAKILSIILLARLQGRVCAAVGHWLCCCFYLRC